MTELERARFLLRRLYPDLEDARLDAIMTRLEAEWHLPEPVPAAAAAPDPFDDTRWEDEGPRYGRPPRAP